VQNGWVGKTLYELQQDIERLKQQLADCDNTEQREQLCDKLNKLRRAKACYLRWIYRACDRF
jgi:predicted RNase H-like nuclease (RuvC/YqgF family)